MTKLSDTSPDAERVLTEVYRKMPLGQKWLRLGALYGEARMLHAAGVLLRNPGATHREIHEKWMSAHFGTLPAPCIRETAMDQSLSSLAVLREVIAVLSGLAIRYALGGSMASSLYGIDRYTRDADITVEPFPGKEAELAASLSSDYYVSLPAIEAAIRNHSTFNIIHTSSGFKIDVFVRADEPFERSAMERRITLEMPDAPGKPIVLHAPEDVILFKLRWFRLGNESSEQQWSDVLGVLRVQAGKLDQEYLAQWAAALRVDDLLARARQESGT